MSTVTHAELQLRAVGASTWGTVKGGVWYPSTSSNPTAIESFRLDLGNYLSVDTPYEWRVRVGVKYTFTIGGVPTTYYGWSAWSDVAQFTPVAVPVVSWVSMTPDLLPTVSWAVVGTQEAYRVRILDSTGLPVYDSGVVVSTATTADVPQQDWTNGAYYTPEVTVWSDFALQSLAVLGCRTNFYRNPRLVSTGRTAGLSVRESANWAGGFVTGLTAPVDSVTTGYRATCGTTATGSNPGINLSGRTYDASPDANAQTPIEGTTIVASVYVRASVARSYNLVSRFSDGSSWLAASSSSASVAVPANTWVRLSQVLTVPAGATHVSVNVTVPGSVSYTAGETITATAVQIEPATALDTYFDGTYTPDSHTAAWTGTADASASTLSAFPVQISWTPPASPTVTVQSSSRPMAVTANGLLASHHEVRCTYVANGQTHSITLPAVEGAVVFEVPLAPYGVATVFSVDASELSGEAELWSDPSTGIGVCSDPGEYLVSDDETDWLRIRIAEDSDRVDTGAVSVFYPLGATRPVRVRTPSQGMRGLTTLKVRTQADKNALLDWLDTNDVFWLRWPPERDASSSYVDVPATRMAQADVWSEERLAQVDLQHRYVPLPWVEQ